MIQKKFNVNLVNDYFKIVPLANITTSNKKLYEYCNAETDAQKQNVRRRKKLLLIKKDTKISTSDNSIDDKKASNDAGPNASKKLSEEFLENIIREGLDDNPNNVQLIGKAVDFFVKVKTDKKEGTKQMLNMEGFLKLADANREK